MSLTQFVVRFPRLVPITLFIATLSLLVQTPIKEQCCFLLSHLLNFLYSGTLFLPSNSVLFLVVPNIVVFKDTGPAVL